jgi:hypothetical protein
MKIKNPSFIIPSAYFVISLLYFLLMPNLFNNLNGSEQSLVDSIGLLMESYFTAWKILVCYWVIPLTSIVFEKTTKKKGLKEGFKYATILCIAFIWISIFIPLPL